MASVNIPNTLEGFLTYIKTHPQYVSKRVRFSIVKRFHKQLSIVKLCKILDVSRSGFYKWLKRGDMLPPLKKWGLLVRVAYRLQPKRAIPVCPTVLSFNLC